MGRAILMSTSPAKDRTDLPGAFALGFVFAQLAYGAAEDRS
jgi:hypothetical protein